MARAIVAGDIPWLFWACDYLAPLTSVFAALLGTTVLGNVGPLTLRLGVAVEFLAAHLLFYLALWRVAGRRAALWAVLWLSAGPSFLFKLTYAPLSAEQYYFLGAVVFWYVLRTRFTRIHHWLVLGLLTGMGWWIHRGVMLVIVPALAVIIWYDCRSFRRVEPILAALVFAAGGGTRLHSDRSRAAGIRSKALRASQAALER